MMDRKEFDKHVLQAAKMKLGAVLVSAVLGILTGFAISMMFTS